MVGKHHGKFGENTMSVSKNFWKNKKVFVTGHTGFKGSWLSICLSDAGAIVKGYSLKPQNNENLFDIANISSLVETEINDVRDYAALKHSLQAFQPDVVIHLAAQPLVLESYANPLETYAINVMGTVNVLEASRHVGSVRAILNVTTDKCYENNEWLWGYRETDRLGGSDPYSNSKSCSEMVTSAYAKSFFDQQEVGIATARAGNVIGGGDWSKDRLVPDILNSFDKSEAVTIRNPNSIRPWQHVLEPLFGYMKLIESLHSKPIDFSGGWNFGPRDESVKDVKWILESMQKLLPEAKWGIENSTHLHEAQLLKLDISKATSKLDWKPTWALDKTLRSIVAWHKAWRSEQNMLLICRQEIEEFNGGEL